MALKLMYITNRPDVALIAEKYGVDRIWIDLETLGKPDVLLHMAWRNGFVHNDPSHINDLSQPF